MPFFFVVDVTTDILAPIFPSEDALAMHPVVLPLSDVLSSVRPLISTITLHLVLLESPDKVRAVLPAEPASAMLASIKVLALVDGPVRPDFFALAVVLIIQPVALVIRPISMVIGAFTVGHVVFPVADVVVAICVNQTPESFLLIVDKVAVVAGPIGPDLRTLAMAVFTSPLACVLYFRHFDEDLSF